MPSDFPTGVAIFFRIMSKDDTLARSIHMSARYVDTSAYGDLNAFVIRDSDDRVLGIFPRDFVAAILPLETVGPGAENANNPAFKPAR